VRAARCDPVIEPARDHLGIGLAARALGVCQADKRGGAVRVAGAQSQFRVRVSRSE
jgi:hypothetical protein